MSASDNLSQQLFHGSSHPFNKGDIVTPMFGKHAFATVNKEYADNYSYHDAERDNNASNPKSLFTYLYKVSPVDAKEMHEESAKWRSGEAREHLGHSKSLDDYIEKQNQSVFVSKKGFKVDDIDTLHNHPVIVTDNKILERLKESPEKRRKRWAEEG